MTLYVGKVRYQVKEKLWVLSVEPDVMLRAKRVFPKIPASAQHVATLSDTAENARDVRWFLTRYPLEISREDLARLDARADEHVEQESVVARILSAGYVPPPCELAVPPYDYQLVVPPLVHANKALLLADDAGTGKTISAIATIVHPDMRPAVVVTLKALPAQWRGMFARFAPSLKTHILRDGPVYDFTAPNKRHDNPGNPDVVILNYHKLVKWAGHLAKWLGGRGCLVFDEIQELRHAKHGNLPVARFEAAISLRDYAAHRLGLSATPAFGLGGQIYNVLEVLKEGQVGSRDEFKREHCKGPDDKLEVKDPDALGAMLDRRGIRLRRTRKQVGRDLPPIQRLMQPIDADLKALAQIKSTAIDLARLMLSHNGDVLKRGQAARDLDWKLRHATGVAKAPHVADFVRMLLESGEKVLLYGWHKDCFARGTRVIMLDGTTKAVEDVVVGDLLMGPDSTPREVTRLMRGRGPLFRIVPKKGKPWVCSQHHVLSLRTKARNRRPLINERLSEFLDRTPRAQRDLVLYRAEAIEFGAPPVREPWLMGYWLGDGASRLESVVIVSEDLEVAAEAELIARRHGLRVTRHMSKRSRKCFFYRFASTRLGKWRRNPLLNLFRDFGLHMNKHIPHVYKVAPIEHRRELLAGLLDSDGHVYRDGNSRGNATFTNKNRVLAEDVATVARSLGLAAYVKSYRRKTPYASRAATYYTVSIFGDLTVIPTRVARKRAPAKSPRRNPLHVGFKVEPCGVGRYFGFEVTGDRLFLLEDFTVVHNCYAIWRERLADWNPVFFTGSETDAQKKESFARFTDPTHKEPSSLFVCSIRAGTGLDGLQQAGCHVGVNGELDWEPEILKQNEARIYRDGQRDPVVFYYCVADVGADPVMLDTLGLKDGILTALNNPYQTKTEAKVDEAAVRERMSRLAADYLAKHDPKALAAVKAENARIASEKQAAKEAKKQGGAPAVPALVPDVEHQPTSESAEIAPAERSAETADLRSDHRYADPAPPEPSLPSTPDVVSPEPPPNLSGAPNGSPALPAGNHPATPEGSLARADPPLDPWAARAAALGRAPGELRRGGPGSVTRRTRGG